MSESTSLVDFLSFCPSLVDILRYVRIQDVTTCRVINRRWSEVIEKHYLTLPRRKAEIDFTLTVMERTNGKSLSLEFSTYHNDNFVCVTDTRTILLKYGGAVDSYYRKNGVPCDNAFEQDNEQIRHVRGKHIGLELKRYQNNGILDGFRTLLTFLCLRYDFKSIKLSQEFIKGYSPKDQKQGIISEEWLNVMAKTLRHTGCYCTELDVSQLMPGLVGIVKSSDCHEISVLSCQTQEDFMKNLFDMSSWNRRLRVCIRFEHFESLEEIGQLLENWETGSLSLNQVELRIFYSLSTKWSHIIDHLMTGLQVARFEKKVSPHEQFDYAIARLVDNKTLQLTSDWNFLNIKEFP